MNNMVILNKASIYRNSNFIKVGKFKGNLLYMGIDKLSFVCDLKSQVEYQDIYRKLGFLSKEKSKKYKIGKVFSKQYKENFKISSKDNPSFYLLISYDPLHNLNSPSIRFEFSPQYTETDSIFNIVEWLKKGIGEGTIKRLFKRARITRLDLTIDIYSKKFITDYYFSISKARSGVRFINNKDDLKNNYAVGSLRSNFYLLVYEKIKLYTSNSYTEELITVREKDIETRITRLELRIKPKDKDKKYQLQNLLELDSPFRLVKIYDGELIRNNIDSFLPYLQAERSLPVAIKRYLASQNGSTRYNRAVLNNLLEKAESKFQLDINWTKWQDIARNLQPFYK
ncbi:TPA: hypothetical protein QB365_000995 [Pasteurella multocida]|nr:hypothetical protein [Pasteurella multocida]HDR1090757.1 hypothetical protein [Pasteurella multocida]HDR1095198.1 hypothetical protein [Pasteurella multocida]